VHVVRRTETTVEREWISIRTQPSYTVEIPTADPLHESRTTASREQIATDEPNQQNHRG